MHYSPEHEATTCLSRDEEKTANDLSHEDQGDLFAIRAVHAPTAQARHTYAGYGRQMRSYWTAHLSGAILALSPFSAACVLTSPVGPYTARAEPGSCELPTGPALEQCVTELVSERSCDRLVSVTQGNQPLACVNVNGDLVQPTQHGWRPV